jgi:hypothetical protein
MEQILELRKIEEVNVLVLGLQSQCQFINERS